MNEGPQAMGSSEINALLGRGSEFEGKLTFEGKVQIDGKFTGEISSEGTLIVGNGARVKAEISVDTVVIQGEVVGNIRAKGGVELQASARLRGNIHTAGLTVEKGAVFDGNCVMEGRESATRQPAQPSPQPTQSALVPEE
ncbi:MAG: polymer-forming cytoskeletal protein [Deltaproteobacteria bacterium]|nr:polymer-forming cytoskeletal protein [Deltaproteobacteria bacterium]